MRSTLSYRLFVVAALAALVAISAPAQAQTLYSFTVVTTGLSGVNGGLAFDFIDGGPTSGTNTAGISAFNTNGTLSGAQVNTGDASGSLPGVLSFGDSSFFNESFRATTFGSLITFTLSATENYTGPDAPDGFSFFLTDGTNSASLVNTSDPTGAGALFLLEIDGASGGHLTLYTVRQPGVSISLGAAVPEPGALASFAAMAFVGGRLLLRRRRKTSNAA